MNEEGKQEFIDLNEAYQVLSDTDLRQKYDELHNLELFTKQDNIVNHQREQSAYQITYQKEGEQEKKQNYYEILGVQQDATEQQIKKAFKKLAVQYHPDKIKNQDHKEEAEKKFAEIANAYETLKDPKQREDYDYQLKHGHAKPGGHHFTNRNDFKDFDQFFNSFFEDFGGFKMNFGFDDEDDIFGGGINMGFGGMGNMGGMGMGSSSTFTSTSFGGMGGGSRSVSTSTVIKNGKRQTITKTTVVNADGTQTVTEEISDGQSTTKKQYMIGGQGGDGNHIIQDQDGDGFMDLGMGMGMNMGMGMGRQRKRKQQRQNNFGGIDLDMFGDLF